LKADLPDAASLSIALGEFNALNKLWQEFWEEVSKVKNQVEMVKACIYR